jgi:DMSO reductase anchor subunit
VSAGFAVLTLWLLLTHPEPLAHRWGIGAYAGSLAIGGSGLLAATLHLSREAADRAFGAVCLAANASAIIVAVYGIVAR